MSKKTNMEKFDSAREVIEDLCLDGEISIPERTKRIKEIAKKYNVKLKWGK